MATTPRLAGTLLSKYLGELGGQAVKTAAPAVGGAVERAALGVAEYADAPGVRGKVAGFLAHTPVAQTLGKTAEVGTGLATAVTVGALQEALTRPRQQEQKKGPYVTPRQQAEYNAMFLAQMQNPGGYYSGL